VREGPTHVDCYVETKRLRVYIEGKRTEELSRGVAWYPKGSQLFRNPESAKHHAAEVPFLQLLIGERPPGVDLESAAA
jgi:hypothetical protein